MIQDFLEAAKHQGQTKALAAFRRRLRSGKARRRRR
jgi:hypothetical protein